MRFLVDECTGPTVATWLRKKGFEVFSVYDDCRGADDDFILLKAHNENWIIITNDKDFGDKVFRDKHPHRGVILLRLENERAESKIKVLSRLLNSYQNRLHHSFVVVTETQVRFAKN